MGGSFLSSLVLGLAVMAFPLSAVSEEVKNGSVNWNDIFHQAEGFLGKAFEVIYALGKEAGLEIGKEVEEEGRQVLIEILTVAAVIGEKIESATLTEPDVQDKCDEIQSLLTGFINKILPMFTRSGKEQLKIVEGMATKVMSELKDRLFKYLRNQSLFPQMQAMIQQNQS